MSLDVWLTQSGTLVPAGSGIFVREGGQNREISREEWNSQFPEREPVVVRPSEDAEVYSANITHNLNQMADAAGVYQALWRPEEIGITKAGQLIEPLRAGLQRLLAEPARFKAFNPSNGWGDYHGLVNFVEGYLAACAEYPDATVSVWR